MSNSQCFITFIDYLSNSFTILPAMSLDGCIDVRVFNHANNGPIFLQFIRDLMDIMQPFPATNSVLVLDNVPVHHIEEVKQITRERYD